MSKVKKLRVNKKLGIIILITVLLIVIVFRCVHMAHPNGRVCGAKRPKCEAERSHHL